MPSSTPLEPTPPAAALRPEVASHRRSRRARRLAAGLLRPLGRLGRLGIRTKLVLLVAVLLGAVAAVILTYLPSRARQASLRALASEADAVARMTAHTVAPLLLFDDRAAAQELLRGALHAGGVTYVVVTAPDGEVFAAQPAAPPWPAEAKATAAADRAELLRTSAPILLDGMLLGRVHVGSALAPLRRETVAVSRTASLLAALVLLIGVVTALAIGSVVTAPLRAMVETARVIGAGDLQRRAPIGGNDEAGELAVSFNTMLDRLAAARRELEELNRDLERRVFERTMTLADEVRDRQRSEQAQRLANERFQLAAAAIDGAVYEWDLCSDRVEWSEGITRAFGHSAAGSPCRLWWWDNVHADDRSEVRRLLARAVVRGEDFQAEYRFRSAQGEYLEVLDRGRLLRDAEDRAVRMVGVMENISARRRLEEQYHHAQRMEAIGRLAGGVAHDFNNLLTAILGYSDLALRAIPAKAAERGHVEEIRRAGERAATLTNQLLAFGRKQVVRPQVLDLDEVVAGLSGMIDRLVGETVRLEHRRSASPVRVRADRGQLEQVLVNVVVNARDAMPAGGTITVTITRRARGESKGGGQGVVPAARYAALEIRDTGCGMDEETRRRIFEPFFTTKPAGGGSGLGMATVYGIVEQCGGHLLVDSAPGAGTTISVLLPEIEDDAMETTLVPGNSELGHGRETLLVVEDEEAVRRLLAGLLRAHGYQVLQAANAEEALAAVRSAAVDLVITDVVMPGLGGRELVDALRLRWPGLPALFVSGYTDDTVLRHGVRADQASFLAKPFSRLELLGKVREVLEAAELTRQEQALAARFSLAG